MRPFFKGESVLAVYKRLACIFRATTTIRHEIIPTDELKEMNRMDTSIKLF